MRPSYSAAATCQRHGQHDGVWRIAPDTASGTCAGTGEDRAGRLPSSAVHSYFGTGGGCRGSVASEELRAGGDNVEQRDREEQAEDQLLHARGDIAQRARDREREGTTKLRGNEEATATQLSCTREWSLSAHRRGAGAFEARRRTAT